MTALQTPKFSLKRGDPCHKGFSGASMGRIAKIDRMNDPKTGQKTAADRRAERLRAALRENLKRRKAQTKAKASSPASEAAGRAGASDAAPVRDSPEAREGPNTPNSAGFAPDKTRG
jgi:hypothetical protein